MLQTQAPSQYGKGGEHKTEFDTKVKLFRTGVMIAMGLFAGTVLGGVVGLFVYANSRTPNAHDGVFAVIQVVGVVLGVAMGYLAARSAEAQEQLIEASQRAGMSMLRKYKPKPGNTGPGNVGQRVIGPSNTGEEFLKTLLGPK
jgi:F0F1-type ATP synthase assembly protein I